MSNWSETRKFYDSEFWQELSRRVRARDNWTCRECHTRAKGDYQRRNMQAHHVISRPHVAWATALDREDNLITLCSACHRLQHGRPGPDQAGTGRFFNRPQGPSPSRAASPPRPRSFRSGRS